MKEFMYTEEDMQIARNAVEHFKKQYQDAQAVIFAIVMQSGGKVEIDQRLLMEAHKKGNILTTFNHPTKLLFCVKRSGK